MFIRFVFDRYGWRKIRLKLEVSKKQITWKKENWINAETHIYTEQSNFAESRFEI